MGNLASCFFVEVQAGTAKLIDLHGNLRSIKLPMTAAELMLEEPGLVVSDINELRSTSRFSAMKADDQLSMGKVYVLVPAVRLHSKLSESDMTIVESACQKRRSKRHRTSKVLPALVEGSSEETGCPVRLPSRDNTCLYSSRVRQWRPALDSISEV